MQARPEAITGKSLGTIEKEHRVNGFGPSNGDGYRRIIRVTFNSILSGDDVELRTSVEVLVGSSDREIVVQSKSFPYTQKTTEFL